MKIINFSQVFKLYTGYSVDGIMTPVLVLLTDKTLYVANMDRNNLCVKFVLAYKDLDVILVIVMYYFLIHFLIIIY